MAGYTGKPLVQKLGIRPEHRVAVLNPPKPLPEGLEQLQAQNGAKPLDVLVLFVESHTQFETEFGLWMYDLHRDGMIWVAWPKKASGRKTDLSDQTIRAFVLTTPFVDVKVCAIDETWSGLKVVVRKELRSGWTTERH